MDGPAKSGILTFPHRVLTDFLLDSHLFCMRTVKEIIKKTVVHFGYFIYKHAGSEDL